MKISQFQKTTHNHLKKNLYQKKMKTRKQQQQVTKKRKKRLHRMKHHRKQLTEKLMMYNAQKLVVQKRVNRINQKVKM